MRKTQTWAYYSYKPEVRKVGDRVAAPAVNLILPAIGGTVQRHLPKLKAVDLPFKLLYCFQSPGPGERRRVELWGRPSKGEPHSQAWDYETRVNDGWVARTYNEISLGPSLADWAKHSGLEFFGFPAGSGGQPHYKYTKTGDLYFGVPTRESGTDRTPLYFVKSIISADKNKPATV